MNLDLNFRRFTLVDFYLDESDEPHGTFELGGEKKELRLLDYIPPKCKLKPVYEVWFGFLDI